MDKKELIEISKFYPRLHTDLGIFKVSQKISTLRDSDGLSILAALCKINFGGP